VHRETAAPGIRQRVQSGALGRAPVSRCSLLAVQTKAIHMIYQNELKFHGSVAARRSAGKSLSIFGGICAKPRKPCQNSPYLSAQAPENRETPENEFINAPWSSSRASRAYNRVNGRRAASLHPAIQSEIGGRQTGLLPAVPSESQTAAAALFSWPLRKR
jgi:hypothetical protein